MYSLIKVKKLSHRYFIQLSYKGTCFHGWQIQSNAFTVQEELDKVLSTLLHEKIETIGSGRTDAGVHAHVFMAHFDTSHAGLEKDARFLFKANHSIHKDIAIHKVLPVKNDAHSRFDAISRTYEYHITRVKNPFNPEFSFYMYGELDIKQMNKAAKILLQVRDFTSFSKLHTDVKTNICRVLKATWTEKNNVLVFTITADRFLRNMVRAIVGTLIDVGLNKISLLQFKEIIESKKRSNAGPSVPAKGLFLTDIKYPSSIIKQHIKIITPKVMGLLC